MHHLKALAFIFFQSTTTNFVVQMNNFISWRILHLKTRLPFTGSAGRSVARLRKETHHGNFLPCRSNPRYHRPVHGCFRRARARSRGPRRRPHSMGGPLEAMPEALRGDATEVIDYGDALSCRAFTTPTFITSIPRCTSPLWPSASWAKTRRCRGTAGAPGCRRPADSWLLTPRLARLLVESRRHAEPRVAGCGLPHASRGPCTPATPTRCG